MYEGYRYKKVDLVQGDPAWHDFRKNKMTASRASSVMCENPWCSPFQLWEEMALGITKKKTAAMQRGNDLEEAARQRMNAHFGVKYEPMVVQSIAHPNFIASLDGYYEDERGEPHIAEIKLPGKKAHFDAQCGYVPKYYVAQLQHQMDLCGVNEMVYWSDDGTAGIPITVKRDEQYCIELFTKELAFLARVLNFDPPET